jgi:hypothetical protein
MEIVLKDMILRPLGEEPRGIEGMSGAHWMHLFALIEARIDGTGTDLLFPDGTWAPLERFCTNMGKLRQWLTKRNAKPWEFSSHVTGGWFFGFSEKSGEIIVSLRASEAVDKLTETIGKDDLRECVFAFKRRLRLQLLERVGEGVAEHIWGRFFSYGVNEAPYM